MVMIIKANFKRMTTQQFQYFFTTQQQQKGENKRTYENCMSCRVNIYEDMKGE
jgi:hypothetical protein